ncbi:MAG: crossover junction endodeoxyribonuclease RuvC [Brevinema sp.]
MIICGIDPGYDRAGYAFLEINSNGVKPLSYGLISTTKEKKLQERLLEVGNDFEQLFQIYKPSHLYIEKLFMGRNTSTVLSVAEARGIIKYLATKNSISIHEIPPSSIKKAVTGYGSAQKNQMIQAITFLLKLSEPPRPDDVADALSIAFCGYLKLS